MNNEVNINDSDRYKSCYNKETTRKGVRRDRGLWVRAVNSIRHRPRKIYLALRSSKPSMIQCFKVKF